MCIVRTPFFSHIAEGVKIEPELNITSPMSRASDHSVSSQSLAESGVLRTTYQENGWSSTNGTFACRPEFFKEVSKVLVAIFE